ncbi:unnamed protein product [Phytophthora lilii]|uniref:Unnamed protein product n=1 Tax=Phytophthora lilii TaxID=2077276 RepID=A0A9W6TFQ9_9STRA|nr:unnamed protein product [Phytophthora lilii]
MWTLLYQAALGLEYLHERGIIHGDLRCSNILIGSDGLAKLTNLGWSLSTTTSGLDRRSTTVGSMRWQPPEVLKCERLSFASDIYSLGMCIVESVTRKMPWDRRDTDLVRTESKLKWYPEDGSWCFAPDCPHENARRLVWRMCCHNPHKRACLYSVVKELDRLVIKESVALQHENQTQRTFDDCYYDERKETWMKVEMQIQKCDNDQYHQAFDELTKVRKRLLESTHLSTIFDRFHELVRDFRKTLMM